MTVSLEFIGLPGPHRDPEAFVKNVRAAKPGMSDHEVVTIVRRANARYRPRWPRSRWQVFGRDILGDLPSMAAWPFLTPDWQRLLALFPLQGGELAPDGPEGAMALQAAIQGGQASGMDRRSLLRPAGLSQSYVWCEENAWLQDVTDNDVAILRATPVLNRSFRNTDLASGPVEIGTYEYGAQERQGFRSTDELERYRQDQERQPSWSGA